MLLDKPSQQSHGGTCKVWLYDVENGIDTWPDIANLSFLDEIVFSGENDWEEMVFTRWTTRPVENRVEENGSALYAFQLRGVAALTTSARRNILHEAERKNYILKYKDQNGLIKIVGTPDDPVSVIATSVNDGQKFGDGTKMEISIQATNKLPFAQYDF
jgi:hypothetical protein